MTVRIAIRTTAQVRIERIYAPISCSDENFPCSDSGTGLDREAGSKAIVPSLFVSIVSPQKRAGVERAESVPTSHEQRSIEQGGGRPDTSENDVRNLLV